MIQSIKMMQNGEKNTKDTIKMVLGLVGGLAADMAISTALGGLMPSGRGWKHLLRMGGTFVIAMMMGEKIEEYICKVFDDTSEAIREAKKELETVEAEVETEGMVK